MMRLFILHKLPTPYNDYFFRALNVEPDIELQVFHLWRGSERRPWVSKLGTGYPNYYMQPKFGIDLHTLRIAWSNRDSVFMVGDWAHIPVIALLFARILNHSPVTLWVDTPQEHLPRPWWKRFTRTFFLKWLFSKVDTIFGSGNPARRVLVDMGAQPQKIVDLQFSVNLDHPIIISQSPLMVHRSRALRKTVGCERSGLIFGISGTLDLSKKAQDIGLKAFAACCEKSSKHLGLLIAGTGQDLGQLKNLVDELGIIDQVKFLGWQEPDEMDVFYMSCDVLLHPANYDPFPVVIIEAMSWSIPVIGTSTSGTVEERVVDGINGFAVSPGDFENMSESMLRFINSPKLLKSASLAARHTAEIWPMARSVEVVKSEMSKLIKYSA